MKAVLEFDLPEDRVDFRNASDANIAFTLIRDIREVIRDLRKYGKGTEQSTLDAIWNMIHEDFQDLDER